MGFLSVIVAAAAAWVFGAIWYTVMSKPWMEDVGLSEETVNNKNPVPFILSFLCAIAVAGMTRHIFAASDVDTVAKGLMSGLGLGLFVATPWLATNYLFAQRPTRLIFLDGVYATVGTTLIGIVLMLF
jgi:hypothetical protein